MLKTGKGDKTSITWGMVEEADQIFGYQILGVGEEGSGYTDLAGFLLKLNFTKMCRDGSGEGSRA